MPMAAVSCCESRQNERCEEIFHEPCLAFEASKTAESPDKTKSHGNGDECESEYEPANIIRKALTAIFLKVKKDADKTDDMKDLQDCNEIAYKKKDYLETLDSHSNGKEEKTSVTKDCLNERSGGDKLKIVKVSEPRERVEDMTEMIQSMFGPFVGNREFDGDEGFLDRKMKKATGMKSKPLIFHENTMQKNFEEEESVLYSSDMDEGVKKTIKAYYGMAGGFTTVVRDSPEQQEAGQQKAGQQEEKSAYDITDNEWQTLDSIYQKEINVNEFFTVQTGNEFQELPIPKCSLGQLQAETVFADMEKKADSRRGLLDYSEVAFAFGVVAITLFAAYRCFRR